MSKVYTYDIFIKNLTDSNGYTVGGYTAQVIPYLENTFSNCYSLLFDDER